MQVLGLLAAGLAPPFAERRKQVAEQVADLGRQHAGFDSLACFCSETAASGWGVGVCKQAPGGALYNSPLP